MKAVKTTIVHTIASSRLRYWLFVIALLQVADVSLSMYIFGKHADAFVYEANPLSAALWQHTGLLGLLALKAAGVTFIALLLRHYEVQQTPGWRAFQRVLFVAISTFIVADVAYWAVRVTL